MPDPVPPTGRKNLDLLKGVSRSPEVAYLQKQATPPAPHYAPLSLLLPGNLWKWVREYFHYRIGFKHPFQTYTDPASDNGVYPLEGGDEIRVALAGDWGTGTDEAHRIADLIRRFDPHYSIHLGDVYFVGEGKEIKENFLGVPMTDFAPCTWPLGSVGTFALNGNHEMYARGYGYFDLILPAMGLRAAGHTQKASFFALCNDHWWIIGLDNGYRSIGTPILEYVFKPDCALPDELIAWMRDHVRPKDDKRAVVLLGHMLVFSAFDEAYPRQAEQLAEFIDRPLLWFWGHEHRLTVYKSVKTTAGIETLGRCIGHGGMPVDLPPSTSKNPEYGIDFVDPRRYKSNENLDVGVNGYVRLTFKHERLTVDYADVDDTIIHSETMINQNGVVQKA